MNDEVIHAPIYGDDGFRRPLCGARDGMLADTQMEANCAQCVLKITTDRWEVVEIIDAGPEADEMAKAIGLRGDEHRTSSAECMACGYRWIAVVPSDCDAALECPACHVQWGIEQDPEDSDA